MIIERIRIGDFGKFSSEELVFGDKLNIIRGDNETGKSTIFAFIRAMLFGIEIKRGVAGKDDIYQKYLPWKTPGAYSGSMDFELRGKRYRITRCFLKGSPECVCTDLDTGRRVELPSGRITDLIPELNESNYMNTIAVGQKNIPVGKTLADGVGNYFANLAMTKTGEVDIPGALETLKKRSKKVKERRKAADITDSGTERDELEERVRRQENELYGLKESMKSSDLQLEQLSDRIKELEAKQTECEELLEGTGPADVTSFENEEDRVNREAESALSEIEKSFSGRQELLERNLTEERKRVEKERQQRMFDAKTEYEKEKKSIKEARNKADEANRTLTERRDALKKRQEENNESAVENALKKKEDAGKLEEAVLHRKDYRKLFLSGLMLIFIGVATAYLFSGKSNIGIGAGLAVAVFGIIFFLMNYVKDREAEMDADALQKEIGGLDAEEERLRESLMLLSKELEQTEREIDRIQESEVLITYRELEVQGRYETENKSAEETAAGKLNEAELNYRTVSGEEQLNNEREKAKLEAERQKRMGELQVKREQVCREAETLLMERRHALETVGNELEHKYYEERILRDNGIRDREHMNELEQSLDEAAERLSELEEKAAAWEKISAETDIELRAIELAADTISKMSEIIYDNFGKKLNSMLSELASKLTAGKYTNVAVQPDMTISFMSDIDFRTSAGLSEGTIEQLYLALRLAVGRLFFKDEQVSVILDEPFAFYDEKRLGSALKELQECDRQVLLFTCRANEESCARQEGIPFNSLLLK